MSGRFAIGIILVAAAGGITYGLWPDRLLASHNLQCDQINQPRAQSICWRLATEMRWTWMGHAIISPGWRVTFDTIRRTFCREHIDQSDLPALEVLRRMAQDWRAESAA